jgi:hypothetical protein
VTTLAFYCGAGNWRDAVIRQTTGSRFSHVELVGPNGQCISASKRDGNQVRQKRIDFKTGHWTFLHTAHDAAQAWAISEQYIDAPYDTLGAVFSGLHVPRHIRGAWFCSELVAHSLGLSEPHRYHPGLLWAELTASA